MRIERPTRSTSVAVRMLAVLVLASGAVAACAPDSAPVGSSVAPAVGPAGARSPAAVPSPAGPTGVDGGGAPPSSAPETSHSPSSSPFDRVAGWRSDLAGLLPAMDRIHPDLGHSTPRPVLDRAVADLAAAVPALTDDEVMAGLLRIVAMVSAGGCDAHTGAFIWGAGTWPVHSLPLRLWWFDEGMVIVDATAGHADLVGSTIRAIDGHPIGEVLAALDPLIPRDNLQTVRLLAPRFLLTVEVLRGLGIAGPGPLALEVAGEDGGDRMVQLEPVPMADYNAWAGPYGLHVPADARVLYLSRMDDVLWWTHLRGGNVLFVQYNRVEPIDLSSLDGLRSALRDPRVTRIVVDVRHNYGGEVQAIDPLLDLLDDPAVDRPGKLFVVTGRNTFSAASLFVARLVAATGAIVVGESMGGCPTAYGDSTDVALRYSGLVVSVAGMLEIGVAADDPRSTIEPMLAARLTPAAWRRGADPALAAILARP